MTAKTTAAEAERLWQWVGNLIDELEEVKAALAVLYGDLEGRQ